MEWIIVNILSIILNTRLVVFGVDNCKDIVNYFEEKIDGIWMDHCKNSVKYLEHKIGGLRGG